MPLLAELFVPLTPLPPLLDLLGVFAGERVGGLLARGVDEDGAVGPLFYLSEVQPYKLGGFLRTKVNYKLL